MIVNRSFMDQSWTDLSSPSQEELDSLILSQKIDPVIAKDLLSPTPKQYAKSYNKNIYAIFHIPSIRQKHKEALEQEIDFVIGKDSLITTRYDSVDAIHHFAKQVEVNGILNKGDSEHLFFGLMREVYKFLYDEIDYTKDWMREIEKNIFAQREKEMVFSISLVGRNLLSLRRTIAPHLSVWNNLAKIGEGMFGKNFEENAISLREECERILSEIEHISLMVSELRETNNSMLSTKQNEVMKILTILAFVTFPLSLIAAIFGMNTLHMPIIGLTNDFWVVIGIMLAMSLAMFGYFKYKRWI